MANPLLDQPLADLLSEAAAVRDLAHGTRVTYSPKVFIPLTMLCRDRCGYCTFAQPPARLDAPYLDARRRCWPSPGPAPRPGCHEALFTLGERPEERYPAAREWLDEHGYASTVDYLVAMCRLVLDETGLLPHANAGALYRRRAGRASAPVAPSQGMMIESLTAATSRPPRAPPTRRPSVAWPPSRPPASWPSRSPPGSSSASASPGTTGSRPWRPSPPRTAATATCRRSSSRTSCPSRARPCTTARPARPTTTSRPSPWPASILPAGRPPAGPAQPLRRLRRPARRRHRRLGRRLPRHRRPREPRAALARPSTACGRSPRPRGHGPRPPAHRLPRVRPRPRALARRRPALRGAGPLRRRGPRPRRPGVVLVQRHAGARAGRRRRRGAQIGPRTLVLRRRRPRARARPADRCRAEVLAGAAGQEVGEDEIVTLFSARGPEVAAVAEVADDLRRQAVGDVVTFVHNRNINYTNVCTFKCKFCGFSKGPLSLNLRGTPYLLHPRRHRRAGPRGRRAGRHRGLPAGRHPPRLRRRLLHRRHPGREGGRARHARPRLHRPRGHRGGPAPRRAAGRATCVRLQDAGLRTLPGTAAEILDDDDPRRPLPRQDRHRGVARGPPHRPRGRPALQHHDHVRGDRAARSLGPPHRAHPRPPEGDRWLHRVRAAAVRAHGHADLPAAQGPPGPDLPRGRAHARRRPHRLPRRSSTTSRPRG